MQKRIKFVCQSTKQLKGPVGPQACSMSLATHSNHAEVQQLAKGPQLHVDAGAVSLAITVDILPLTLANWMDHHPVLLASSKWSQERASQPRKIELITSYKNEYK
jgi:hypothetical protein